ncbi:hypothetical protein LIA77_03824 [Sarocladium implicatum]|nr:hypothetical protein LIA77_03824 [Sarocladium implicatum]
MSTCGSPPRLTERNRSRTSIDKVSNQEANKSAYGHGSWREICWFYQSHLHVQDFSNTHKIRDLISMCDEPQDRLYRVAQLFPATRAAARHAYYLACSSLDPLSNGFKRNYVMYDDVGAVP